MKRLQCPRQCFFWIISILFSLLIACNRSNAPKIAFASERDGNWEIYLMNVDGSNPINMTNNPEAHDTEPKWSPDGRKLAFTSHGSVIIININGEIIGQHAPEKRIVDHPSWSPDSGYVALHSTIDGNFEIYTMKDTGTELTRLTVNPTYADSCPEWSPDGEFIAFGSGEMGGFDLYLMRPDGSDVTDSLETWAGGTCPLIDWSPDGKFLATISRNLGVFNRDERNQHRIISECAIGYPDWSPDGQKSSSPEMNVQTTWLKVKSMWSMQMERI